jgi:UPF0271 protein
MIAIDLNCDMGESPEAVADGTQEGLMPFLTSVNIACGGHAGNETTMALTLRQAKRWGLAAGAHPGYPDPANFGRKDMALIAQQVAQTVFEQVMALVRIADREHIPLSHVKPHGALYNQAARDAGLARSIAQGVAMWSRDVILVGLAGSVMLSAFEEEGFAVAAEAFADRRYEPDGTLRSRAFTDALISDPKQAAAQALGIARNGKASCLDGATVTVKAQTICLHSDTAGALGIAAEISRVLKQEGFTVRALSR